MGTQLGRAWAEKDGSIRCSQERLRKEDRTEWLRIEPCREVDVCVSRCVQRGESRRESGQDGEEVTS